MKWIKCHNFLSNLEAKYIWITEIDTLVLPIFIRISFKVLVL